MTEDIPGRAVSNIIIMITQRLRRAYQTADAAEVCTASGNYENAFRILLNIEQDIHEADALLNAAAVIHRESRA